MKHASQAPIEFTGYTKQGDELVEWRDDEIPQHAVAINREARGLPDIAFHFAAQPEAHALFMALCEAEAVMVEGDPWEKENEQQVTALKDLLKKYIGLLLFAQPTIHDPKSWRAEREKLEQEAAELGVRLFEGEQA